MKRILYVIIAVALMAVGCTPKLESQLSVSPTSLEFTGEAGTQTLTITSSGAWTLTQTENTAWCTPSRSVGKGSATIKVSVKANTPQERTTELVFNASGSAPVVVTVKQLAGTNVGGGSTDVELSDVPVGISIAPEILNADYAAKIYVKAGSSSALYNHTGDIYAHIGVVDDYNEWHCVMSEWPNPEDKTQWEKCNFEKNKLTKEADNVWSLSLEPTIREWFESGDIPVNKIGVVIRSEDGTKKLQDNDEFFEGIIDDKNVAVPFEPDPVVTRPLENGASYGINYNDDQSVTFVLYDKDTNGASHKYCYIVGDWNNWERIKEGSMFRDNTSGCWWIRLSGFEADKEYRFQYRLGNETGADTFLSDPYTEIVYDQWNDQYIAGVPAFPEGARQLVSAFQINRPEYAWKHKDFKVEDKNDLVIYEMLFRDFTASQNIAGAMAQLDYIENLGVNAIELMPIQEFDGNKSWGYNPNHYFALDKYYGTRDEYKAFIDECHARGIAVIVDVVYNHATGSHPWAKLYWDAASNCTAANNPWFNVVARHDFNVYHDINHENQMIKDHVKQSLEYLLTEYDVDGFRFDLSKGFTQKNTLGNTGAWGNYDQSRVDILNGYADHIWSVNKDAVVIFEHLADWSEEKVLADHGIQLWRNMNGSYRSAVGGGNGNFSGSYEASNYGGWVSYMESHDEERLCYGAGADASTVTWGICGTLTSWGSSPDISMKADGAFFVAKGVTFKADDMFKIRGNSMWNDAFNYGASTKGYKLPLNKEYKLTLGAGSQDMAVPAAGTYDIYFSLAAEKVWLMTPGQRPSDPAVGPGTGGGSAAADDPFSVAMRRAGASAAFFLTVPGPKMIWQFGEIGYDYSIDYNDRTGEKPVVTDQYMAVPARKALYDTYASLLKFRRENPRFFDKDAKFEWTPSGAVKKITCSVDGKTFHVVGNFGKNSTTVTLPDGQWKDYMNDNTSFISGSVTLKEGEFKLLVK
ncbi:MAG: alpha-amylase family glycosyl hydrolase [Bacteroidales bacterium]|nr:alpha-amylase family glycosyl hydrolase [Bacteroidales bacterium]